MITALFADMCFATKPSWAPHSTNTALTTNTNGHKPLLSLETVFIFTVEKKTTTIHCFFSRSYFITQRLLLGLEYDCFASANGKSADFLFCNDSDLIAQMRRDGPAVAWASRGGSVTVLQPSFLLGGMPCLDANQTPVCFFLFCMFLASFSNLKNMFRLRHKTTWMWTPQTRTRQAKLQRPRMVVLAPFSQQLAALSLSLSPLFFPLFFVSVITNPVA